MAEMQKTATYMPILGTPLAIRIDALEWYRMEVREALATLKALAFA